MNPNIWLSLSLQIHASLTVRSYLRGPLTFTIFRLYHLIYLTFLLFTPLAVSIHLGMELGNQRGFGCSLVTAHWISTGSTMIYLSRWFIPERRRGSKKNRLLPMDYGHWYWGRESWKISPLHEILIIPFFLTTFSSSLPFPLTLLNSRFYVLTSLSMSTSLTHLYMHIINRVSELHFWRLLLGNPNSSPRYGNLPFYKCPLRNLHWLGVSQIYTWAIPIY